MIVLWHEPKKEKEKGLHQKAKTTCPVHNELTVLFLQFQKELMTQSIL